MKNTTILKSLEDIDHKNGYGHLLAARIYNIPKNDRKTDSEGKNPEGNNLTKLEGAPSAK